MEDVIKLREFEWIILGIISIIIKNFVIVSNLVFYVGNVNGCINCIV